MISSSKLRDLWSRAERDPATISRHASSIRAFYASAIHNAEDREAARQAEIERCKLDVCHFIDLWAYTYDPRLAGTGVPTDIPFILRPRQLDFLHWLDDRLASREHGLVEKSRAEGATWLAGLYALHKILWVPGFKVGFGSRKWSLVESKDDLDAIFPKIRFALSRLPAWMIPFPIEASTKTLGKIINPLTHAAITGEGGDEIGRGGRNSMYFVDEFAAIPRANRIDAALSQNADTIVYISTPYGYGNLFSKKRHGGKLPIFTFHWKDNPEKNQQAERQREDGTTETYYPWYDEQEGKHDPVIVAQEIDIDYGASLEGAIIPGKWVQAAVGFLLPRRGDQIAGMDVGEGKAETVLCLRHGPCIVGLECWYDDNTVASAHRASRMIQQTFGQAVDGAIPPHLRFDAVGVGSGVSGALRASDEDLGFTLEAYNAGASASSIKYSDDPARAAHLRFQNRKIEDLWALRLRFFRTYQMRHGLAEHPFEDCISIPNDGELIAQLSVTRYFATETGKIRAESKRELSSRGIASPDRAEAVQIAFSPWPKPRTDRRALVAL